MYHIKDDKRAKTSAELICRALARCLETSPWEELSITRVCREATVSRATFYRLFDRLEDVAAYSHELLSQRFLSRLNEFPPEEILTYVFQDGMDRCAHMETLMRTRQDDILRDFFLRHQATLRHALTLTCPQLEVTDYHCAVLSSALSGMLLHWFRHGKQETAAQMAEIFRRTLRDLSAE